MLIWCKIFVLVQRLKWNSVNGKYMSLLVKTIVVIIVLIFLPKPLITSVLYNNEDKKTILQKNDEFGAKEIITGDTLKLDSTQKDQINLPGGTAEKFTASQDSAYYRALRVRVPAIVRLQYDMSVYGDALRNQLFEKDIDQWDVAKDNISSIDPDLYKPSGVEMVHRETSVMNSQYIPFVKTIMPYGLKVNLSDIGNLLGLTEDYSPILRYNLDYATDVEIVIYSVNAAVIAVLFDGHQPAGAYSLRWNGRNDKGMRMPSGDYVGEVRIGKTKYVRKRIIVP